MGQSFLLRGCLPRAETIGYELPLWCYFQAASSTSSYLERGGGGLGKCGKCNYLALASDVAIECADSALLAGTCS
jgi:hypothetical protein